VNELAESLEAQVSADELLHREFDRCLATFSSLAFRVAVAVLRNREDAEDVAQEALIKAYRNFQQLREPGSFRPWLVRITWRLAVDRRRSAGRRERRELAAADANVDRMDAAARSVEMAASQEFQRRLDQAIDELPEKLRQVLLLAAVQGYDMREVAQFLNLPEGTVKSRLNAARKRLAEKLRWLVSDIKAG
jgi:RNA polymerase sigma-70 factor, ECF subfamily